MKLTAKQIKQEILDMVEQGIFDPNEPYIFEDLPFGNNPDVIAIINKHDWKVFTYLHSSGIFNNVIIAKIDSIFGTMYPYFVRQKIESKTIPQYYCGLTSPDSELFSQLSKLYDVDTFF